jgi:hypothetical protein
MLGCNLNGGTKESGNECVGTDRQLSRVAHEGVDEDGPKGGVQAVDRRHAGQVVRRQELEEPSKSPISFHDDEERR